MSARRQRFLWALLLGLLLPSVAEAQYFAKINDIGVTADGNAEVYVSVLDRYGEPPELSAYESVKVYFGEANEFPLEGDQIQLYGDSDKGTDYVIILPAYEGFGLNNSIAAAEGAGAFQTSFVGEADTCMVFVYGDGVAPFDGNAGELAAGYAEEGIARVARPYMLSAIDEAVRYYDDLPVGRRRIIILVGTGLDVRLADASRVDPDLITNEGDFERVRQQVLEDHEEILKGYIQAVEVANARIYAIGYNDHRADYLEVLRALSRKTGGTYRRVTNIGDLATTGGTSGVFTWVGEEIAHELILRPEFEVESHHEYEVWASFRFPDQTQVLADVQTRIFYFDAPERPPGPGGIITILIVIGIILIVIFLLLVVLYFVFRKTRQQRQDVAEKKALQEKVAAAQLYCRTCYRKKMPEWKDCMFCGAGMAPLEEKPAPLVEAEEAQAQLDELAGGPKIPAEAMVAGSAAAVAFYASHHGKPTCTTCGRVVDPAWPSCMFCAAGMAPLEDLPPEPQVPVGDLAKPVAGRGLAPKKPDE